jgi:hypothetical protein
MGNHTSKTDKDMVICFVLFNPAKTKRMLMNYFYSRSQFEQQGLPVYTLELLYQDAEPEIPDAFHVHTKSYMFHKENLYRLLMKRLPKRTHKKVAFLDADVFFKDPTWYAQASAMLDTYDIVQPFETAHWLDLTYKNIMLSRKSVVCNEKEAWDFAYHPGFAWCMRKKWYKRHGFFDYAITGSGDTLSTAAWLKKKFPKNFQSLPKPLVAEYEAYKQDMNPKVGYLKGVDIYHLYHGSRENRQYAERHKMLNVGGTIHDYIEPNEEGVFEWKDKNKWNPLLLHYFQTRDDDSVYSVPEPAQTKKQTS